MESHFEDFFFINYQIKAKNILNFQESKKLFYILDRKQDLSDQFNKAKRAENKKTIYQCYRCGHKKQLILVKIKIQQVAIVTPVKTAIEKIKKYNLEKTVGENLFKVKNLNT